MNGCHFGEGFQLVVSQIDGMYLAKDPSLAAHLKKAKELIASFEKVMLQQLPRDENSHADALVNVASNVHMEGNWSILVAIFEKQSFVLPEVYTVQLDDSV